MKESCELELRVKNGGISLHNSRRIRENDVICPYERNLRVVDPVKLKQRISVIEVCQAARAIGNLGRFISHGCEANCHIEQLNVDHGTKIAIVAARAIQAGEEIISNYGPDQKYLLRVWISTVCQQEPS
ncbi:hypothetical protein PPTG_21022 [Phytophthora nicotianae INRA-310]|uniref:SET domain-containing protein n=1 Tax=Phytophthora nicotianae (strain INRA-310) TaxID=761204 RepID=W2R643_PHYN3|nr:hypothetical protein PPTG_21022 [Phytophthora nicotianae INRA-310]ETN20863.1 hypothetical protein PPTG_21022 [Phytophthora nicotianae INRA-310]